MADDTENFEERRHDPPHTLREAIEIIQSTVDERIKAHLNQHNIQEQARQDAMLHEMREGMSELRRLLTAGFPNEDPAAHRRHHEETMEFYRDMKALMIEVRNKTITGIVWGGIILVSLSVWHYVKAKVGSP